MTETAHGTATVSLVFAKAPLRDHHQLLLQILSQGKEEKQAAGHIVMATIKNANRMKTVSKMEPTVFFIRKRFKQKKKTHHKRNTSTPKPSP